MLPANAADVPRVRAFVETAKREIEQAERAYDVRQASLLLAQLARPLTHPSEYPSSWKRIYLDQLYRDVAKFVLTFVAAHLLPGFSSTQRRDSFDVFFDAPHVPALNSLSVLMTQIAITKPRSSSPSDGAAADETAQILTQSVRLLQRALDADGVRRLVDQLLQSEDHASAAGHRRVLAAAQPTVSSLCSVPDLVFNRLERKTPACFARQSFHARLSTQLLDGLVAYGTSSGTTAVVFRLFTEKLVRIGHIDSLVRAWLTRRDHYDPLVAEAHSRLIGALPASALEPYLSHLSSIPDIPDRAEDVEAAVSSPQYRLLSLTPTALTSNKQFQFVVAHKLLLAKSVRDPLFLRMLVETLATTEAEDPPPLEAVFDVVVNRWSSELFPTTADYALNFSMTFFLRYAMTQLNHAAFLDRDWTMKLCKGVQHHMGHSVARVRVLGMRVGESVSRIMSPDQLLNFDIPEEDPVDVYARVRFDFSLAVAADDGGSSRGARQDIQDESNGVRLPDSAKRARKKKPKGVAFMDPDEIVESDDEAEEEEEEEEEQGSDSDSDTSLVAFDLHDDEQDLKPQRPVYLKDLLTGLHTDDDREKTETALAEAEHLLRRRPKDLDYQAKAIVTALLRLEDKYSTPNFTSLRANALAAACALSPAASIPYLQQQALEKEQLLQSRIDVLQALCSAAHELSETGAFRPEAAKHLLREDLDTRTMENLKTRRFGYRRDPIAVAKKNAFGDHALAFFSPLVVGYVHYVKSLEGSKRLSEVEDVFLAHLLHALATFVECAGHAPSAVPMAKALMAFAWHHRTNSAAAVRRQVLYAWSRVLLVMPPFLLRQELGSDAMEMMAWLQQTREQDPDDGCREASRLLLSSGAVPMLTMP